MSPEDERQVERTCKLAQALTQEAAGGTIGDALLFMLGVQSQDALLVLVAQAEESIEHREGLARKDGQPDGGHAPAFLTGVELGIAAERARREQDVPGGVRP